MLPAGHGVIVSVGKGVTKQDAPGAQSARLFTFLRAEANHPGRGIDVRRVPPHLFLKVFMAKEELIEMRGKVDEVLPDSRYRVTLENGHQLVAYTGGKMRRHNIRVIAGDAVSLEMSPYDLTKGRITFRHIAGRPPMTPRR